MTAKGWAEAAAKATDEAKGMRNLVEKLKATSSKRALVLISSEEK